jgi:hypothetical protein
VLVTALVMAPALARGNSLHDSPLPRPAPAAARSTQATPGSRVQPAAPTVRSPEADTRGAQATPAGPKPLNMVRNAPEELGQVPDHFFWLREGLQAAQDPIDGDLVFITNEGRIAGRAALPPGFVIGKVVTDNGEVRLLDSAGRLQVSIARNIDARNVKSLQALPVMANMGRRIEVTRRGPDLLILREQGRDARRLEVRSVAGGRLAQAYEIGSPSVDRRYIVSEEVVATVPSLKVNVFVRRFDAAGQVTGIVYIPLDGFEVVPHDFIAVDGQGRVRVLASTASGVKIREYEFSSPPAVQRRMSDTDLRRMGRAIREFGVETNFVYSQPRRGFRSGGIRFVVKPPTPKISREEVLKNADAYLTVNWLMRAENFSNPTIENRCSPTEAKFWRRPNNLTSALVGKTIGPMPYRWGGDDTPQSFKARLEWGALAGDICTCRNAALDFCLQLQSAGVDCSGFVSRAWGIGKRGTAGLLDVSDDLPSIADLKPGDAFDWPGRHIRLFVAMAEGPEIGFTVLEASTRHDCEGVCRRTYRPSEMNGYRLIRYKGITE